MSQCSLRVFRDGECLVLCLPEDQSRHYVFRPEIKAAPIDRVWFRGRKEAIEAALVYGCQVDEIKIIIPDAAAPK